MGGAKDPLRKLLDARKLVGVKNGTVKALVKTTVRKIKSPDLKKSSFPRGSDFVTF